MESKVKWLDDIGIVDKFMNYCGKPVTSEVTFGQTGLICLWSADEGDRWHHCMLLSNGVPLSSAILEKV